MAVSSLLFSIILILSVTFVFIKYSLGMQRKFEYQDRFDNNVTHYVFQELYNVLVDRAPYRCVFCLLISLSIFEYENELFIIIKVFIGTKYSCEMKNLFI